MEHQDNLELVVVEVVVLEIHKDIAILVHPHPKADLVVQAALELL
jgi:hypothetical protein